MVWAYYHRNKVFQSGYHLGYGNTPTKPRPTPTGKVERERVAQKKVTFGEQNIDEELKGMKDDIKKLAAVSRYTPIKGCPR